MKKRVFTILITLVVTIMCAFSFVGCGSVSETPSGSTGENIGSSEEDGENTDNANDANSSENTDSTHTHKYITTVVAPTCVDKGYTLHACDCGDEYKDNYTDPTGNHNFEDYICTVCGEIDPTAPVTDGLEYTPIKENGVTVAYSVSKGDAGNSKFIKIPSEYQRCPVTTIKREGFMGCSSLVRIEIPNSVTDIGDLAFYFCSSLTNIELPNSVKSIAEFAFNSCSSLTSIEIPNGVTSIGDGVFSGCSSLTSIYIPNSVTSLASDAFLDCGSLASINVESGNSIYHSNGNCIIESATKTLILGCKTSVIPTDGSVTSIGTYAFEGCTGLISIAIPSCVTSIGQGAFFYCNSLASITIPSSVTRIRESAFSDCSSLTNVIFKNTNNWQAGNTQISSSDLDNEATAAEYLREIYKSSIWTRIE